MKCSEAILMGNGLKKSDASIFLDSYRNSDGTIHSCGCALGGAGLAAGMKPFVLSKEIKKQTLGWKQPIDYILEMFPWLETPFTLDQAPAGFEVGECYIPTLHRNQAYWMISDLYIMVSAGEMSLEQLVDWVRSVEPECESCCRFDCQCQPAASEVSESELKEVVA